MDNPTESGPSRKADKPPKPYPDFPLTPHNSGAWMKKIKGRIHYFGKWGRVVDGKLVRIREDGDWAKALQLYEEQAEALHAGRRPRKKNTPGTDEDDGLTVADLCNHFLTAKQRKRTSGELGSRMFQDYKEMTDMLVAAFGASRRVDDLAAHDFEELRARMSKRWGPVRLGNGITRVKSVFKYGLDNELLERTPCFGSEFRKPDKASLRRHRAQNGEKMLEADQLRALIGAASVPLRAMILLGVNAGFGNHDCATLPLTALDLDTGWVHFPRPKTGISRRCPLWPETVTAIREALAERPKPKDKADAGIVFLQSSGRRWVRNTEKARTDDVSVFFTALMKKVGVHRSGTSFYTLRHVFRTIADEALDRVAIDLIMGHSDPSMGGHYRERIDDARLAAVAEHVRAWLFGEVPNGGTTDEDSDGTEANKLCDTEDSPDHDDGHERPTLRLFAG